MINFATIYFIQLLFILFMVVYGIPNCNTVKKSLDWLKAHQIDFEFHDFKKKGITAEKLNDWCNAFGWETVLNRKGLTWKKLTKEAQTNIDTQEKAIAYLIENTSAIKRPVIEKDGQAILISFDEDRYAQTLG
ncbi:Spx/MgsR family RNA polymerase-binding regulatory protein [Pedobacter chinensis]|nr:Spx/MgsR family RNA polymerase-binding regulatory protein [Pedobacter chinensis]